MDDSLPSNNIWHVDYNATVAKDAAMGWQGMGFVLGFNGIMFLVALVIFQAGARSTRFSLFRFGTTSIVSASAQEVAHFTLEKWKDLLWRTPIRNTDVELRLGPEGTFYLLYLKYTARFLGVLSMIAMLVLLPLYLTIGANAMNQVEAAAEAAVEDIQAIADKSVQQSLDLFAKENAVDSADTLANGSASSQEDGDNKWWSFAHATIRVMPHESPYLWVPVVMSYLTTFVFLVYYRQLKALTTIPTHSLEQKTKHELPQRSSSSLSSVGQTAGEGDKSRKTEQESSMLEAVVLSTTEIAENKPLLDNNLGKDKHHGKTMKRSPLIGMQPSALSNRSLFVNRGLPKYIREQRVLRLLDEVFPGYVDEVCVVYNLAEFHNLQARRREEETQLARMKILHERALNGKKPSWSLRLLPGTVMLPSFRLLLGNLFCCYRWCVKTIPMEEQVAQRVNDIKKLREQEMACLSRILHENKGAGRAFIIFKSARLRARFARRVRNQSITSILARFPEHIQPRLVRYVRELGLTRWHLEAAPEPDDIDWQSVSFPFAKRTVVVILVNVCILVVLLLFTSPIAVTSAISSSSSYSTSAAQSLSDLVAHLGDLLKKVSPRMAKLMANYIPTLILVMINAVLLNVLQLAGRIQPISTDSAKERLILRTASVYLIFNTIFVPSLAFMSIDAVLLYLEDDGEVLGMLGTLFLHNSGIFYVDYILQRCFLGTALVLLRATEYIKFSWTTSRALTPREKVQAVEADQFYTGTQSATQISTLTIVLMFSTVVPLILPLGTLYFLMQHVVDKYSLLHVRRRIKGRGSIARTATHGTCVSLLLYQGAMSGFILERGTTAQSTAIFVLLMGTYIVVLWGYVRDKEQQHRMIARGGHQRIETSPSLESTGMSIKEGAFPLNMLVSDESVVNTSNEHGEPEKAPAGEEEALPTESRRLLETLNETSPLLMYPINSESDVLPCLDANSSDWYREPALRQSMRMSFGPQDLGDYGTWRQV
ncbi:vacuolar protein sorting-associated [Plasmopara halstedii]|uniref:Vacuolar protein sorting-associated n=1 Tax=Plasmopara halstedii TaxID=4781 RepID=A0A0P1AKL7_PLAHL|nr:vacuolar protein sorting-associated [Plasmopara halstedii]CEG41424.1 vacuolar protein sorting-associated [Plasmopara halstedii]|eukprot:XP_024577793.1 vacuolar protein sorting-associated [Plasmopara halstedii]